MAPIRTLVWGTALATAVAVTMIVPSILGISTWKYLLAAIALVLFVLAERREDPS